MPLLQKIVFLATDSSSFIYGAKLAVEGGRTAIWFAQLRIRASRAALWLLVKQLSPSHRDIKRRSTTRRSGVERQNSRSQRKSNTP